MLPLSHLETMHIKKTENYSVPMSTYLNVFHAFYLSPFKVVVSPKLGKESAWTTEIISTKSSKVCKPQIM